MSNSQLPVAQTVSFNPSDSTPSQYAVLSQDGYTVTVSNSVCSPLSIGQILTFDSDVQGVVTATTPTQATVQLYSLISVISASPLGWFPIPTTPNLKLFYPSSLLGSLSVQCINTGTQLPGYLGWTLFDSQGNILAIGNDLYNKNICSFSGSSSWGIGSYTLTVRSFTPITLSPIRYASLTWNVLSPSPLLSAGNPNDLISKLTLN